MEQATRRITTFSKLPALAWLALIVFPGMLAVLSLQREIVQFLAV